MAKSTSNSDSPLQVHVFASVADAVAAAEMAAAPSKDATTTNKCHPSCAVDLASFLATCSISHSSSNTKDAFVCPVCQSSFPVRFVKSVVVHKENEKKDNGHDDENKNHWLLFKYRTQIFYLQMVPKQSPALLAQEFLANALGLEADDIKILHKGKVLYPLPKEAAGDDALRLSQKLLALSTIPKNASNNNKNMSLFCSKPQLLVMGTPKAQHLREPPPQKFWQGQGRDNDDGNNNDNDNNNQLLLWALLPVAVVIAVAAVGWYSSRRGGSAPGRE